MSVGNCIFVSYTLRDNFLNKELLLNLEKHLEKFGEPYIDLLHNRSEDPQRYVLEMLEKAKIVVACITPSFLKSKWVRIEITYAQKHKIPIKLLPITKEPISKNKLVQILNH